MVAVASAGEAGGEVDHQGGGGDGHHAGGGTRLYGKTYQRRRRNKIPQETQEEQGNQVDEPHVRFRSWSAVALEPGHRRSIFKLKVTPLLRPALLQRRRWNA